MANARSPNYPGIGLPDAINRLNSIYQVEHRAKAAPEVIAKAMGFKSLNGSSLTVLSALKKYGLLDEVGKDLKVSDDGLLILVEPTDSEERHNAIERAAFMPSLFAEIRKNYGDSMPSDDNLRAFLLRKGFVPSTVDSPIRAYRETMALVGASKKGENAALDTEAAPMEVTTHQQRPTQDVRRALPATQSAPITGAPVGGAIPVTKNCTMTILADGEVTQEALERLSQYIDLIKSWYPEKTTSDEQHP